MAEDAMKKLFDEVAITVIPSEDLPLSQVLDLRDVIDARGGKYIPLREGDQQIENLDNLTHIISTHIEFPQYAAALEHGIHIVKPSWVIASIHKNKLTTPRQHSPDPSQYMHEVIVTTAGLPEGDKDTVIAGVIALGGQYSGALSKLCTHIIALDLDNEKCRKAQEMKLGCKIVLPHWFYDCFKLGRKISERPYTLPDPEYLRKNHTAKVRDTSSGALEGAVSPSPSSMPVSSPPSSPTHVRKNLNTFMCKKILLSKDLQLSEPAHNTLKGLISHGGGLLTIDVDEADIYIGHYRDGDDYMKASRAGKEVANLSWLYHVINLNKYSSPLSKLFHYPIPRGGLPGFEHMRISISNYTGDARAYLENLIKYCGAEFTKTMKQDNTHLITAHTQSEKCEAAEEWNINIVNHIWLEESYAKCAVQSMTNPRYQCFPARTNLGEVTGQTSLDMKRVEHGFFPKVTQTPHKVVKSVGPTKPSPRKTVSSALASTTINQQSDVPTLRPEDEEMDDEQPEPQTEPPTAKKSRGRPRRSVATPASHVRDEEKENESPLLLSSGRASKTKALGMLHQQADDIALYQKEMKRKGGVTHGRGSFTAEDFSSPMPAEPQPRRKKRTSDEATYDVTAEGSDLSDGETQPPKAMKRAKNAPASEDALPPIRYRMLVTGDNRWVDKPDKESQDKMKLRQLGVLLVTDPKNVDIMVAPRILRTRKFVSALTSAPTVVDTSYLDTALKSRKLIEEPEVLYDPETEDKYGFKLSEALERAEEKKGNLLRGWSIFVTRDVNGGLETYKEIITLNGGECYAYAGRTGLTIPKRRLGPEPVDSDAEEAEDDGEVEYDDYVYLVSGTSAAEMKLWKMFRSTAEKQGLKARVVNNDWLLTSCMAQEVRWDPKWELTES